MSYPFSLDWLCARFHFMSLFSQIIRGLNFWTTVSLSEKTRTLFSPLRLNQLERILCNLWPLLPWIIGGALGLTTGDAAAQALFESATQRLCEAYRFGKGVIYAIAGIGILILGAFAMLGRFDFARFFAVAGGIFLASSAEQIISMLGGSAVGCTRGIGGGGGGIGPPAG